MDAFMQEAQQLVEEQPLVAGAAFAGATLVFYLGFYVSSVRSDKGRDWSAALPTSMLSNSDTVLGKNDVKDAVEHYDKLFGGARDNVGEISTAESIKKREAEYDVMVNSFYNLVTDFYEWGWGQSFHFAPRFVGETFEESIARSEHHLASRLGLKPGMKCVDVGCGVGGPMRSIARFSGASVTGVTICEYQVKVGNKYNKSKHLSHIAESKQGDFQKPLPFADKELDCAYEIEATCHSPNKTVCFSQINRCLKQGGLFAGYEWVVLKNYDGNNKRHVELKEGIEVGNGLPTLATPAEVVLALEGAGFEVLDHYDANDTDRLGEGQIPWYATLDGSFTLKGFRMTRPGRFCTHVMVSILETLRIAPAGTTRVSAILSDTAVDLVDSGKKEIFTPSYFFVARKVRDVAV